MYVQGSFGVKNNKKWNVRKETYEFSKKERNPTSRGFALWAFKLILKVISNPWLENVVGDFRYFEWHLCNDLWKNVMKSHCEKCSTKNSKFLCSWDIKNPLRHFPDNNMIQLYTKPISDTCNHGGVIISQPKSPSLP